MRVYQLLKKIVCLFFFYFQVHALPLYLIEGNRTGQHTPRPINPDTTKLMGSSSYCPCLTLDVLNINYAISFCVINTNFCFPFLLLIENELYFFIYQVNREKIHLNVSKQIVFNNLYFYNETMAKLLYFSVLFVK